MKMVRSSSSHNNQGLINNNLEEMMGREIHDASSDNGGDEHKAMHNSMQGVAGPAEDVEIRGELGLEPEIYLQVDNMLQNNGDIPLSPYTTAQSPQHSPISVVDSASSSNIPPEINRASDLLMAVSVGAQDNRNKIINVALSAMEELPRKAIKGEPLWQRQVNSTTEILNEAEYIRQFHASDATLQDIIRMIEVKGPQQLANLDGNDEFTSGIKDKPTFQRAAKTAVLRTEASRDIGFVNISPTILVEWLMDVNQWSSIFSNIVSRATKLGVLSTGVAGNCDGMLQVMRAEFHWPSPLVPIRECQFARYCKMIGSGTWAVVDVSLENLFPYPQIRFHRRPSGCLIQEMPNRLTKVTWVEHVEADNTFVHRNFQLLVLSGFAFSAKRWVATLIRHCQWLATSMSRSSLTVRGALVLPSGKESLLRLAERMMRSFCLDVSASSNNKWMPLPASDDAEDIRVMTKSITPVVGSPIPTIAFTNSLWLPAPPKRVFDFLRHENSRNKWDILHHEHVVHELTHIIKGGRPENRLSIMQVIAPPNDVQIFYLQETYSDPTGYHIVYAPMDIAAMAAVLKGGNPDNVTILPSGFVIHPDRPILNGEETRGSILTIAFHIVNGPMPNGQIPPQSIDVINRILRHTAIFTKINVLPDDDLPVGQWLLKVQSLPQLL